MTDHFIIKDLRVEKNKLLNQRLRIWKELQHIDSQIETVDKHIQEWKHRHEPPCTCCGRHRPKEQMWIASKEEADKYTDKNKEGYSGPIEGELYCGC